MSTPRDHDGLDVRGAAAAADLQARAAARPRPTFDPDRTEGLVVRLATTRPPVRRGRSLAAVAAALVLVAGGVTWWTVRPGRVTGDLGDRVVVGEPRPFVATDLPAGLRLFGATDAGHDVGAGPTDGDSPIFGPTALYGADARHPGLGIAVVDTWQDDDEVDGQQPLDVPGVDGYRLDGVGLGLHALVFRSGDRGVLVASGELDGDELAALIPRIRVDGLVASLVTADVPEGWQPLGELADGFLGINPVSLPRGAIASQPVHSTVYVAGDLAAGDGQDLAYADVTTSAGGEAQAFGARLYAEESEEVEVRGHPALLGHGPSIEGAAGESWTVSWEERPGEVVRVAAYAVARADVLALAEGLEPVPADEWRDLVLRSQLGRLDPFAGPEVGAGTFADGTPWVLRLDQQDGAEDDGGSSPYTELSVALDRSGGSSSTSGVGQQIGGDGEVPVPSGILTTTTDDYGSRRFLSGLVADDVARLELRRSDGTVVGEPALVAAAGHRGFAVELPEDDDLVLVALGAGGAEVVELGVEPVDLPGGSGSDVCEQVLDEGGATGSCEGASATTVPD